MNYVLTNEADEDLVQSYLYGLMNFGLEQAEHYARDIEDCLGLISDFPELARERGEFSPPVRIHHHSKHYIVYRIEADHILIIRILRDDVDLTRHLEP